MKKFKKLVLVVCIVMCVSMLAISASAYSSPVSYSLDSDNTSDQVYYASKDSGEIKNEVTTFSPTGKGLTLNTKPATANFFGSMISKRTGLFTSPYSVNAGVTNGTIVYVNLSLTSYSGLSNVSVKGTVAG